MMSICLTWVPFSELGEPNIYQNLCDLTRMWEDCGGVSDCEELMGEVNHTTECMTDLLRIFDVEWIILLSNSILRVVYFYSF